MRSKEVEEAIDSLKIHTQTYLDEFTTDFQDDFMGKVETVLSYIEKQDKIIDKAINEIEILRQDFDESLQCDFIRILEILKDKKVIDW